ncbi:MAG: aminotransferase class I/II-fold pyridoxal phosphate-dependent enzyme [Pseudomonadota bacterium]
MSAAAAAEAAGQEVLHLEVGQPGTAAPSTALAALRDRMAQENLGYTVACGLPELRSRISQHYADHYSVIVPPERIVITSGSSAGFVLSFLAAFNPGDRLAVPSPGYPCYRQTPHALGLETVPLVTGPEDRWMPTPDMLRDAARNQGIAGALIASPANPTGTMMDPERLRDIIRVCEAERLWYLSDEIYHGLSYGVEEQTALAYSDSCVVINSFSKYFSMTGWRIGWMVVPAEMVSTVERLTQNLYIAASTASQVAALGAFDGRAELEANREVYQRNRDLLIDGLPRVGLDRIVPADGGFYLYVDVSAYTDDSLEFTRQMLDEVGVAATPGLDFDPDRGRGYVRFSYAGPTDVMQRALNRLGEWDRLTSPQT